MNADLLVIAKEPIPGRSKTRLSPPLSPSEAASVAEAALADTLATVASVAARRRILVLDGSPGAWLPSGFEIVPQTDGGLDARLAGAFSATEGPALLVGMDTPQVSAALLERAFGVLSEEGNDAVLGPAEDGGWWAIGLMKPSPEVFLGLPMSSGDTCAAQVKRLEGLGLAWSELPTLRDIDVIEDARAVAVENPDRRFSQKLREIEESWAPTA
ncbi:MAG: TIGR04282 family arsenosugar biosynthesis glycosyltransferase [Actinomycetota bacterium]|nr:TIGR04282 family arsenosugar biosynthesis glycosyltransferase [Actinomycetota bacterium]